MQGLLFETNFGRSSIPEFSFTVTNQTGEAVTSLIVDLTTAAMPNIVWDPDGVAGDNEGRPLTIGSGFEFVTDVEYLKPEGGGFGAVKISLEGFLSGSTLQFGLDADPTSIQGSVAPGPNDTADISGFEMIGATVMATGAANTYTGELYQRLSNEVASRTLAKVQPTAAPTLELVGFQWSLLSNQRVVTNRQNFTVRATAAAGQTVELLQTEAGLFTEGNPGEPYEFNKALGVVSEQDKAVNAQGTADYAITLQESEPAAGLNYVVAAVEADVDTGLVSQAIVFDYQNRDLLLGTQADDLVIGSTGADRAWGGAGNDVITGLEGNDLLGGLAGNDTLFGHDGIDIIDGGAGNDYLSGGSNFNRLTGRDGADIFQVNLQGVQIITDFSAADGIDGDVAAVRSGIWGWSSDDAILLANNDQGQLRAVAVAIGAAQFFS